jgi:hypothetical protein
MGGTMRHNFERGTPNNYPSQDCFDFVQWFHEGIHVKVEDGRGTPSDDKSFNFPIVNFPFISSNIPAATAYGVYISQLIFQSLWFLSGFP